MQATNVKGTHSMNRLLKRPSVPTVIATLALVFAMAGVAPAAKKLIVGKDIAKNAITTNHVKDHTLKAVDFAPGVLKSGGSGPAGPAGLTGPKGATGPQGAQGDSGAAGENGLDGAPGDDGAPGVDGVDGTNGQGPAYVHSFTGLNVTTSTANVAVLGSGTPLGLAPYVVSVAASVSAASNTVVTCFFNVGPDVVNPLLVSPSFTTTVKAGGTATMAWSWGRMVSGGFVKLNCVGDNAATIDHLVLTAIQATTVTDNA
jgi:hypothetical protein